MNISAKDVKELRERTGAGMMECKKALVEAGGDMDAAIDAMRKSGVAKAAKRAGKTAAEGAVVIARSGDGGTAAMVEVNCETDFVAKGDEFQAFADAVAAKALENPAADLEALLATPLEAGGVSIGERCQELAARIGENINVRRVAVSTAAGDAIGTYLHGSPSRIGVLVDMQGATEEVGREIAMHIAASRPVCVTEADVPGQTLEQEQEIFRAQAAASGKPPEIIEKMIAGRMKKFVGEITLLGQPFVKDPDSTVAGVLADAGAEVLGFVRFEVGEGIEKKVENFAEEVMAQAKGG